MRLRLVICLVLVLLGHNASPARPDSTFTAPFDSAIVPQHLTPDSTGVNKTRLYIVTGALAAGALTIELYQLSGWWKDNRRSFHFQEDLKYGLNVDKFGHFYGAMLGTFMFKKSLEWANLSEESALWWGAGAALFFQTYVEVQDGFSAWGFDRVDFASDVLGAAYPVAQFHIPFLQNFNFKGSYHPSSLLNEPGGVGFKGQKHLIFDDYEGQTVWLSVRVHDLLPEPVSSWWPSWLCIAGGYGARDVALSNPYPVYFVGLDLDLTRIIPQDTPFLRTLSQALNFLRMPLPAVQLSPHVVVHGVYF
jgi:hypothetical protein